DPAQNEAARAAKIAGLQQAHFIGALDRCPAPDELPALERTVDALKVHSADVTLILFPLQPVLMKDMPPGVLARYRAVLADVGRRHGVRILDGAQLPLITDDDFMDALDHLNAAGAARLASWALAHDLAFLAP